MNYKYDKEADVLSIEFSEAPIEYAKEMGNFIMHFSPDDRPVYLEVLDAKKFVKSAAKLVPVKIKEPAVLQA